jgi:hypothetical protein
MNIFILDEDPVIAARMQCDRHVVKMTLETAQMLCSAHPSGIAPYKQAHMKHPCTIWTSASMSNYLWLCRHGMELASEYWRRYNKTHKSGNVIWWCWTNLPNIPDISLTPFAQAMPDKYKCDDAVTAYRNYYIGEKSKFAKWKNGNIPEWYLQGLPNDVSMQVLQQEFQTI